LYIESRKDKEIALNAVENNGMAYKFVFSNLKTDKEIIFTALISDAGAFIQMKKNLRRNKELILQCVKFNPQIYQYFHKDWKENYFPEFYESNPKCFKFCDLNEFQGNKEMFWKSKGYFKHIREIPKNINFLFVYF
jgi:hypothetical protein